MSTHPLARLLLTALLCAGGVCGVLAADVSQLQGAWRLQAGEFVDGQGGVVNYASRKLAGTKVLAGSWTVAAVAAGTAAHYRIVDNAGTTCHEQGSVTMTGGGGDMTLDNTSIAAAQVVTITAKTLTAGGA